MRPRQSAPSSRREGGYAAVLTALILVPLLGFAGFAVDVGAWYGQASSLQRAADAAALAGVIYQPDFAEAEAAARAVATRNGFTHGVDGIEVNVTDSGSNELEVEIIDTSADLYFSSLFLDNVTIGRTAVAEYNNPVALGSPGRTLGQQMPDGCFESISNDGSTCSGPGPHPGFFLDVGGPTAGHSWGEPISTQCLTGSAGSCDHANPQYDADGYTFAIDVPPGAVGSPLTVEIFDPSHAIFPNKGGTSGLPIHPNSGNGSARRSFVEYSVFAADGYGLSTPKHTPVPGCTAVYDPVYDVNEAARWVTHCTFTPAVADIYPMRVRTIGFAGADTEAESLDAFSLRLSSTAGTQPSLYAMEYMGIFSNSNLVTQFDFAQIEERHAGKIIRMQLFDAGDGSGTGDFHMIPLDPSNSTVPAADCRYRSYSVGSSPGAWQPSDSGSQCEVHTRVGGTSLYNNKWLEIEINLGTGYTCGSDCWWSVFYDLGGSGVFFERTTWSVQIVGDPVRLLE